MKHLCVVCRAVGDYEMRFAFAQKQDGWVDITEEPSNWGHWPPSEAYAVFLHAKRLLRDKYIVELREWNP